MYSTVVLATLVGYKIMLVLIVFWAQRRVQSEQDFSKPHASWAPELLRSATPPVLHLPGHYSE